ncbi:MAG: hypothetical protein AB7P02_09995 [Alphaproteobacteria bacterium]
MRIVMLVLAVALATAGARADELRFEIKNCYRNPIDVSVYNGDDIARWFTSSGWQGMKTGETIGFVCDEGGRGECQVSINIQNEQDSRGDPYLVDVRTTLCFGGHERTRFLYSRCDPCPQ